MKSKEVIRRLKEDGWYVVRQKGSHKQLKHETKPGTVTVPDHPGDVREKWRDSMSRAIV